MGPLAILIVTPAARLDALRLQSPVFFWGCLAGIAAVVVHYLGFSMSPGTSYMPSIVLASLPLWAISFALLKNRSQLWVIISVLVCLFAIVSAFDFISVRQRAHAPLRDPGNYVTLLYLIWLPWAFRHFDEVWDGWRLGLLGGLSFVFLLAMLASHSRVAMGVVLFGCLLQLVSSWYFRRGWLAAGIVCASGLLAAIVYIGLDQGGILSTLSNGGNDAGGGERGLIWSAAWQGVKDIGGLSGTGLYTFSLIYPQFRSPLEQATAGVLVHNDFLQIFLEGGLLLFVPLVLMVVCVVFSGLRYLSRRDKSAKELCYLLALAVALCHAGLNFVFYSLPLAILFGILLAKSFAPNELATDVGAIRHWPGSSLKGLGVCLMLVNLLFLSVDVFTFGVLAGQNHVPYAKHVRDNAARTRAYLTFAQAVNGRRSLPRFAEANLMEQDLAATPSSLGFAQTDQAYQRAVAGAPFNALGMLNYANFLGRFGNGAEVTAQRERLLQDAFAISRSNVPVNMALFARHQQMVQPEKLLELSYTVAQWCQLMSKHPQAKLLFNQVLEFSQQTNDEALSRRLIACLERDPALRGGGRKKTWFMRWLEEQRAY